MRTEKDIERILNHHQKEEKRFKEKARLSRLELKDMDAIKHTCESEKHRAAARALLWALDLPF